jgi:hypothetical protein
VAARVVDFEQMQMTMITTIRQQLIQWIDKITGALFQYPHDWLSWLISSAWLAGLWLYGLRLWNFFYSGGEISFDFLDWGEVTGPRYALLHDAALRGLLPLHAADLTALRGITDRYFSIADTPFLPQYLLLQWLDTGRFLFLDTLLFYTLGFIALVLIFLRQKLSPFTFSVLFLLFSFNGNQVSHLAVGHHNWTAQFLIPFFVLLVLWLVEEQRFSWAWVLALSLLELVILLQGGFHLFLWNLFFLGVLALFNPRLLKPVLAGALFSTLVSLWRLLPPSLALDGLRQEYLGGFPSVHDLFEGLVVLRDPFRAVQGITDTFPLNGWETNFYIGWLGFLLLVTFGIALPLWRSRARESVQVQVLVPCLLLAIFSIGEMFAKILAVFPIPPLIGERVTSRMLILPLITVAVLGAIFAQRELRTARLSLWSKLLLLLGGYLVFHDLYQHLQAWRIRYLDAMVNLFPKVPFDAAAHTLANHPDPAYTQLLAAGLGVALAALVFLVFASLWKRPARPVTLRPAP